MSASKKVSPPTELLPMAEAMISISTVLPLAPELTWVPAQLTRRGTHVSDSQGTGRISFVCRGTAFMKPVSEGRPALLRLVDIASGFAHR